MGARIGAREHDAIAGIASRFRAGGASAVAVARDHLDRIAETEPTLHAFVHVARDGAMATARGVDLLASGGTDLGPLMGVPVAVKDHFVVNGMPTTAGTALEIGDLLPAEGSFIRALKRAGCVILGKTRATEFALGTFNLTRPRPLNPCDAGTPRMTGGSSNGSAAALAAGLCAFATGTDTGGSVREPAALCGLVGYKPTAGLWPTDGVVPLSPTLDTVGLLTTSVGDAITLFETLAGASVPVRGGGVRGLRLGRPSAPFWSELDARVEARALGAVAALERAGAEVIPVDVPEVGDVDPLFAWLVPAELIAVIGRERFLEGRPRIDPVCRARAEAGLAVSGTECIELLRTHQRLCAAADQRMRPFDAWITPTAPDPAIPVADCATVDDAAAWNRRTLRNTRPVNAFGQCAISIPIPVADDELPVGLQLIGRRGDDAALLAVARAVEEMLAVEAVADEGSRAGATARS